MKTYLIRLNTSLAYTSGWSKRNSELFEPTNKGAVIYAESEKEAFDKFNAKIPTIGGQFNPAYLMAKEII